MEGLVQGVGFRPHVYRLAQELKLAGFVGNDARGVFMELEGRAEQVAEFQVRLRNSPPPASFIDQITERALSPKEESDFVILASRPGDAPEVWISPDLDCCEECLQEVLNPNERRYLYPFANCTHCGPRYTLVQSLPYDRARTTMSDFELCADCAEEYNNPEDRRFHAQPIACPACGPKLSADLDQLVQWLQNGEIIALKGVGGYHLVADAEKENTLRRLRHQKRRPAKPMAVMVANLTIARELAEVSESEAGLLVQRAKPIVLLRGRGKLPEAIAPGLSTLGVMLPYSPLHHLLFDRGSLRALVMTSGNLSGQPIASVREEASKQLDGLAERFVHHDRAIEIPCDDSVVREFRGGQIPIRRSRGFAPFPVKLPRSLKPSLAVGAQMKSTFCLGSGRRAYLSQHLGDLEHLETLEYFERVVKHLTRLYGIEPEYLCCDSHPDILSSRWAEQQGLPVVKVQHHHAHLAAALAEHGLELALGIILDGTGYGDDGTVWGGEILRGGYSSFERVAFLKPVPLAGGDIAVREPWRLALAHLWAADIPWDPRLACVQAAGEGLSLFRKQLEKSLNTIPTSSVGRLFDAVAALCGLKQEVAYEAEAAILLEHLADPGEGGAYRFGEPWDMGLLMAEIVHDLGRDLGPSRISMKFHRGLARHLASLAARHHQGLPVVLSGGVFQNTLLTELLLQQLEQRTMTAYIHRLVPPNDGGLSLGQLMVGAARMETGEKICA